MRRKALRSAISLSLLISGVSLISPQTANASLYAFTSHTFTNCSITGPSGPTTGNCRTAYSTTWDESDSNYTNTGGIQYWTVPSTGRYYIDAYGAGGGGTFGGNGARMADTFDLNQGEVIRILVGQPQSGTSTSANAGGGGTFVVRTPFNTNGSILVIAGGGAGAESSSSQQANAHASTTTSGNAGNGTVSSTGAGAGGTNGSGGGAASSDNSGGGGGGFLTNGTSNTPMDNRGGFAFVNGGGGGPLGSMGNIAGGFGGGGASRNQAAGGGGAGGGGGYSGGGGGDNQVNFAGGGGGSYIANGLNINRITNSLGRAAATTGFVTITALGPSLTTFAPRATLTNSSTIVYDITFSQTVTGLATNDFSVSGTGSSNCTIGTPSGSGTTYTVTLSGCSPGTVILTMATNAVTNTSSQTAPASNTAAATVTIDQTAPSISTITAPTNRTYIPSETPTFTVAFSESVTITGTPRLTLTVGSTTEYANFLSMSDSRTALFRYTVAIDPLEFDTDGIAITTSLDLNSGSIADLATNAIVDRTFSAPTLTSVLVAQPPAAPTIDSITATSGILTVFFTPGAARGSTTSNYQFSTNNGGVWSTRSPVATTSPLVISGLNNAQGYQVRLRAITNAGTSDSSTAVTETPTAVSVSGDATLTLTYGNSASTGSYSATGGTNTYTWSLGSVISGITLSGTTVTAANTLAAGTYSQTVRATDTNSQVGSRSLTITVNRATTSISIALPNSSTSAALGGAITISATVSRAGSVNFQLGGSTIAGCGSAVAASTTATCSWTPAAIGSVSLTAIFSPTDSANFETSTTTTLAITVVNGVSTVTLSLAGGATTVPKGQAINIIAAIDQAGRVTFLIDGKRVPGCINRLASIGNISCSWRPAVQKPVVITANLNPTNNVFNSASSRLAVHVTRRTGNR